MPRATQTNPFQTRMREFGEWLPGILIEKDLVFVGFWSDWAYLNQVLEGVLNGTHAGRIVLVNPSDPDELQEKAPGLWALANAYGTEFIHVRQAGDQFLDELRQAFGAQFMKRMVAWDEEHFLKPITAPAPAVPVSVRYHRATSMNVVKMPLGLSGEHCSDQDSRPNHATPWGDALGNE